MKFQCVCEIFWKKLKTTNFGKIEKAENIGKLKEF